MSEVLNRFAVVFLCFLQMLSPLDSNFILLLPTTPKKATSLPPADASRKEVIRHIYGFNVNCIPVNLTGHPALSIPCGLSDALPVGLMLIGRHYEESTIYRAAYAFEQANDWKTFEG